MIDVEYLHVQADADTECILRMCLDLLALQRLEAAGSNSSENADTLHAATEPAQALQTKGRPEKCPSGQAFSAAPASEDNSPVSDLNAAVAAGGATAAGSPADGRAGAAAASSSSDAQPPRPPLPPLRHADFSLLQCHPVSLSERDAQQWRRAMAFLLAALERSGWPQPLPPQVRSQRFLGRMLTPKQKQKAKR